MILLVTLILADPQIESILSRPIDAVHKRYDVRDEKGIGLDCLKVERAGDKQYLGVHHTVVAGVFQLRLVESPDLLAWKQVIKLDDHAHQGTLVTVGNRWVLAWEKDGPEGNYIHLAAFDSTADLKANRPMKTVDIPRKLSPAAEGTPNIRRVMFNGDWSKSQIDLGFHYWRNRDVDRQAYGWVRNFQDMPFRGIDTVINPQLEDKYRGNIGDRDEFTFEKRTYIALEAQYRKDDWASWRILLGEPGGKMKELRMVTERRSTSFANPAITALTLPNGKPGLFVSYFMPSQGNAREEAGQLIYYRELKASGASSSTSN